MCLQRAKTFSGWVVAKSWNWKLEPNTNSQKGSYGGGNEYRLIAMLTQQKKFIKKKTVVPVKMGKFHTV